MAITTESGFGERNDYDEMKEGIETALSYAEGTLDFNTLYASVGDLGNQEETKEALTELSSDGNVKKYLVKDEEGNCDFHYESSI